MAINKIPDQVLYLGRWVDKTHFRAFVYNETGKKLADSYKEYADLIGSGLWYAEKQNVPHTEKVIEITRKQTKRRR